MSDFPFTDHRTLAEAWRDRLYYWKHREKILARWHKMYYAAERRKELIRDTWNDKNRWEDTPPNWPRDAFRF